VDFRRRGRIADEYIQAIKVQGDTGPWLSGPAGLPEVMPVFRPSVV
jgi:hypothetical protein